ncbi:CGNR zinc finger domain-containing protein [Amycolatopsis sp. NPDC059021]|uniref:CGNR zinc finger domain-containing protein n=1 Tax=Amycolatopsis sp. NPDC059021 TaxID=3346704 RepID=UPI00366F406B
MAWDWQIEAAEFHRVPERLVPVYDFMNTVDERTFGGRTPDDRLPDWLHERGEFTAAELRLAELLRKALRGMATVNRTGEPNEETAHDLARAGEDLPLHADGRLLLRPYQEGVTGSLAELLATVVLTSADGSWSRMKTCAAPDCGWVFYDRSKPRNGRWCSTAGCGNRVKTRSYRERKGVHSS